MTGSTPCVAFLIVTSVLAAVAPENRPSQTSKSTQDGLTLLNKLQEALGGAQRLADVRDLEETIRAEAWDSAGGALGEVRKRTRWMRTPNLLRLDQRGPRGTYVLYYDGDAKTGWEILPDVTSPDRFKTTGKAIELAGGELEFARSYLSGFELDMWLADREPGFTVTAPGPNVLRIQHDGKANDFRVDPATGLPLTSAGVSLADPDHPVPSEMRYEDWREISGVRFPTHRVSYHSGLKRGEVTTSDIRVNVGLRPQDLAAKPADFLPDVAG